MEEGCRAVNLKNSIIERARDIVTADTVVQISAVDVNLVLYIKDALVKTLMECLGDSSLAITKANEAQIEAWFVKAKRMSGVQTIYRYDCSVRHNVLTGCFVHLVFAPDEDDAVAVTGVATHVSFDVTQNWWRDSKLDQLKEVFMGSAQTRLNSAWDIGCKVDPNVDLRLAKLDSKGKRIK